MSDLEPIVIVEIFTEQFVRATDKIITATMDIFDDCPRRADGTIADPYDRGCLDGILALSNQLRTGMQAGLEDARKQSGAAE